MRFHHVCLEAFGYVLPDEVITSEEIERRLAPLYERFRLNPGRLELMTGIRERRFWKPGTLPSDVAAQAGARALEGSGTRADEIDCIIHGAVSRDCLEPATASIVHHRLGLQSGAAVFDLSNACLGFLNGMICLAGMIELGHLKKGLIVSGESSRQLVETTLRELLNNPAITKNELKLAFASLTIGSGAVALVMAHESVSKSGHRLVGGAIRSDTQHHDLCRGSADTGFTDGAAMLMSTDSEELMVRGCRLAAETWSSFCEVMNWNSAEVNRIYTHQVGIAHRDLLYKTLGLDLDKDFTTVEFLGNVGSVSLPITMALGIERKAPTPGERIAMLGIGSGMNCVMLGVEW